MKSAYRPTFFPHLRSFYRNRGWTLHLLGTLLVYILLTQCVKLFFLTQMTYWMRDSRFVDIGDLYFPNEIILTGLGTALFWMSWGAFTPWIAGLFPRAHFRMHIPPRLSPKQITQETTQGALQGLIVASGLLLAFLLSGLYRYLGIVFDWSTLGNAIGALLTRTLALLALCGGQEWLLRGIVFDNVRLRFSFLPTAVVNVAITVVLQSFLFGWGWMQSVSFSLLAISFCLRRRSGGTYWQGAVYLFVVTFVLHVFASLPWLGAEYMGVFLIKPVADSRWITGGIAGPFSSFAFQAITATDILRQIYRSKRRQSDGE